MSVLHLSGSGTRFSTLNTGPRSLEKTLLLIKRCEGVIQWTDVTARLSEHRPFLA